MTDTTVTIKIKDGIIDFNDVKVKGDDYDDDKLSFIFNALDIYYKMKIGSKIKLGNKQAVPPNTGPGDGNRK